MDLCNTFFQIYLYICLQRTLILWKLYFSFFPLFHVTSWAATWCGISPLRLSYYSLLNMSPTLTHCKTMVCFVTECDICELLLIVFSLLDLSLSLSPQLHLCGTITWRLATKGRVLWPPLVPWKTRKPIPFSPLHLLILSLCKLTDIKHKKT